ncbi:MAG: DUF4364 family protein [Vallitaleaceae bacterium]|jgi:predicted transcriptional regulator|nr:DUF4364 family protein [Vallitaleaceae bacterium]
MNASDQELSLNKLIILYMLNKSNQRLSNTQISDFVLDSGYTNYFSLQEYLNQLTDTYLIRNEKLGNNSIYHITPEGITTLSFFTNRIPESTREEIHTYLEEHAIEIKTSVEIVANYMPGLSGDYLVHCYVKDGDVLLMEIKLTIFDKDSAIAICEKWKEKNADLYIDFLGKLIE